MQISFYIGAGLSFGAAVASLLRGQRYIYEVEQAKKAREVKVEVPIPVIRSSAASEGDANGGKEAGSDGQRAMQSSLNNNGLADPHVTATHDHDDDAEKEDQQ